jgi:hypothetical protein
MLRGQFSNQLRAERARETSKLIAIIDDDDAMRDSLRGLMKAAGLVARCFGSAEEFLSGTRGYPFAGRRAPKPTSQKANRAHDPQSASRSNFPLIDGLGRLGSRFDF